jgi:hypothetical protein
MRYPYPLIPWITGRSRLEFWFFLATIPVFNYENRLRDMPLSVEFLALANLQLLILFYLHYVDKFQYVLIIW